MKKYIIIFVCLIVVILSLAAYIFEQYKSKKSEISKNNLYYEDIYNKEITSGDIATIVNNAMDKNDRNGIAKDDNDMYIENDINSIKIDIKFLQSDEIYSIEPIYNNDISRFVRIYNTSKFKCTKIEYHKKTKFVKYLYFEEIN